MTASDPAVGAAQPQAQPPTQAASQSAPVVAPGGKESTLGAEPATMKPTKDGSSNCASGVYWPPFSRLKSYLDRLKFELSTLPTLSSESRAFLDLYAKSLQGGLGKTFLPRNGGSTRNGAFGASDASKAPTVSADAGAVVQGGGTRKVSFPRYVESSTAPGLIVQDGVIEVEVDAQMEEHAEEVSKCLNLDASQSLYLVWMYGGGDPMGWLGFSAGGSSNKRVKTGSLTSSSGAFNDPRMSSATGDARPPSPSTNCAYSLAGVCQLYCDERLSLLRSLETILWIGEDPVAVSEVRDYVESRLIEGLLFANEGVGNGAGAGSKDGDVEEVVVRDLKVALGTFKQSAAYKAVVVAQGNKEDVNWAKVVVQGMEKERIKMLTLLSLIYYRPRKACSVPRFVELLRLGHAGSDQTDLAQSASLSQSVLSMSALTTGRESRMYVLLLLEILVLEINGPLRDVAERGNHGQYAFLDADVALRITDVMREFALFVVTGNGISERSSAHVSVLVLTWASILLVLSDDEQQKRMGRELAQLCSRSKSGEHSRGSILQHLSLISTSTNAFENPKQMAQLSALILYHSLAVFLAAFDFGKDDAVTRQLVDILVTLFNQDSVHDMFVYNHEDALTQPVLRFLDALEPMGVQQLKLLTAISSSHNGSVFAYSYLLLMGNSPHTELLSQLRQSMVTRDEASLSTAAVILNFYDALCSSNAVTVMEILDVQLENDENGLDDIISVLGLCIRAPDGDQLTETAVSTGTILASAFKLLSYVVPYSPDRVLSEILSGTGVSPVSLKLEFFDQMMSRASTALGYQAVLALLQLVSVMLQTAYGPKDMAIAISMKLIQIAVPYISCMASSEEKWDLAAGCLTIVRHALMRADNTSSDSLEPGGMGHAVSKKDVLVLISPILPPECKFIANDVEHQGETEAIEKCVVKWLRLVPVLLSEGPPVYDYLFQSVNGRNPPAATLLSYLSYPYFGSEDKAAVVRSMAHLLGYDSNVPVTAFLPKDGPRLSLLEPCKVISDSINVDSPTHVDSLFSAACDVLCNAVSYHPTLAVLLLPDLSSSSAQEGGGPSTLECSCTQHILSFAERAFELYSSHPSRLEKVLDVICAAISSKKSRNGIMTALVPNEKIWKAFMDILLQSAGDQSERDHNSVAKEEDGKDEKDPIDFHCFNVEMKVMDIFVAAMCSADEDRDSFNSSLWQHVDVPIKAHLDSVVNHLIRRYCGLISRMNIDEENLRARRLSWLAGLRVIAFSLENNGLYASLRYEQHSLVANMWTCILKSDTRLENPNRGCLVEVCQGLYDTFIDVERAGVDMRSILHKEPYLSMANLLLTLCDEPLPLPHQIGSAWPKVIGEFALLEAQTKRLKELTRLQSCLFECISSLGSFVAVCTDRHPKSLGGGNFVANLDDLIGVVRSSVEGNQYRTQDALMDAAVVGASRLAVLLSHRRDAYLVSEQRLFELITLLAEHQGVDTVDECLGDWLTVCINIVEGGMQARHEADLMDTPEGDELNGILPWLLPLIGASHTRVSCSAASLLMMLMASRVRPAVWEEQVESLDITELLCGLAAMPYRGITVAKEGETQGRVVLRIKSLLLLLSQMISDSSHIANVLISKGLCDAIVSVCHWVKDALPLVGCATYVADFGPNGSTPALADSNRGYNVDFAGRYTESGARYEVHRVWCIVLSLCSLLSSSLPGHQKVETLMLRVSVSMADRIGLSLRIPSDPSSRTHDDGNPRFLTLGYLEEGRATLGFICALSRLEGEWLISQPKMVTQMRRLTASFVDFASGRVCESSFAAIAPRELRENGISSSPTLLHTPVLFGADPVLQLSVTGETVGEASAVVTELSLTMAGHFYAMVKYALDFQLISAPEICEAEARNLAGKDTWVQVQALEDLLTTVASILDSMSDDQSSRGMEIVRNLALRLMEIAKNATSLLMRISPQPLRASSLASTAAAKVRERILT